MEALSATGLRSIRYAKEVPGVKEIIANDLSSSAVRSIVENVRLNLVEHLVTPKESDAMTLMYNSTKVQDRFDAIDLGKQTSIENLVKNVIIHTFCYRSLWKSN